MAVLMNKIVITTGDPNGIGAEITIKALNKLNTDASKISIISNRNILNYYGRLNKDYEIIEIPYSSEIKAGEITKEAGEFSYLSLKRACEIRPSAIVTAPVAKHALYLAGHKYSGQTEILQKYLAKDGQSAEMLFVAGNFRVLLLTRHLPLKEIKLTKDEVKEKIINLNKFFAERFNIQNPKFALCGFNPHAGEDGILGREEIDVLIPAVEELRENGIDITKPLPADTLFSKIRKNGDNWIADYDCYIANYHDQGLIPIKALAGSKTVNMTMGLDIIRTSPGHGTAFDIAGKNIADETSMIEALKEAMKFTFN